MSMSLHFELLTSGGMPLSLQGQLLITSASQNSNDKGKMQARWRTNSPAVMDPPPTAQAVAEGV